jgi:organic radical activating enzyme
MTSSAASLVEIFASWQGEGPYAGVPQVFVRFDLCNIRCAYCDTPEGLVPQSDCRIETSPFSRSFEHHPNPLPLEVCASHLRRLGADSVRFHSVTFTGGEPLLHAGFLAALLPHARRIFPRTYLDTNGTLPAALESVIHAIDIVALDIKLPSCPGVKSGGRTGSEDALWKAAEDSLRIAARRAAAGGDLFVKVVLTRESTEEEMGRAAGLIAAVRPATPLILQPATRIPGGPEPPDDTRVRALHARAAAQLPDVRVLPQLHPYLGWK